VVRVKCVTDWRKTRMARDHLGKLNENGNLERTSRKSKNSTHYTRILRHLIRISYQLHSFIKERYEGKKKKKL